jgi:hypothetical protein
MRIRANMFAILILVLTFAACTNKQTPSTAENQQPANTSNQQPGATSPPQQPQQQQPQQQPPQQQTDANTPPPAAPAAPSEPTPPPPPPPPPPVVIPTGTTLTVQVDQAISTKTAKEGDAFTATVAHPITVEGKRVVPKGARVQGVVVQSKSPGKFKGEGTLSVKLTKLTVKGVSYPIDTAPNVSSEKSKGKRSAVMIGGGTGGGALIGGIAGGGKGALVGGLLGAGAGTAGAGLTGNKDLAIPVETAISFRLQHPLTLQGTTADESAGMAPVQPH